MFEAIWGVTLDSEPGLRIPNMLDAAVEGTFKGIYIQGEDIVQSDPDTKHVVGRPRRDGMRRRAGSLPQRDGELRPCLPAGLDLPGEGRHLHQCRAPHPARAQGDGAEARARRLGGDHRLLAKAMGYRCNTTIPPRSWTRSRALTPTFAGVSYDKLDELGSVQWPCNDKAPEGTPIMHIDGFVRGKGRFMVTEYVPTDERTGPRFPLLLTTGRILCQYNVGAQTRRTANVAWHEEDLLEIHPHDAEQRGIRDGDWVQARKPRRRDDPARADHRPRRARRRLHDLPSPDTQANVVTTEYSDWATNCPEYKVTAVQVLPSNGPTRMAGGI